MLSADTAALGTMAVVKAIDITFGVFVALFETRYTVNESYIEFRGAFSILLVSVIRSLTNI